MSTTTVEEALNFVDSTLDRYVFDSYQSLSGALTAPFWLATTLFVMIYGYLILANKVNPSPSDLISMLMKLTIGYILIIEWGLINQLLVKTITETPSYLIGELTGGDSVYSSLGAVSESVLRAAGAGFDSEGWIMPFVAGSIIFVSGMLAVLYAFAIILISKLSLAVLLALTPLFGIAFLFKGTSRMMEAWFQQIVNVCLLILMTVLVLEVLTTLYAEAIDMIPSDSDEITLGSCLGLLLIGSASFICLMQIKSLSSAIAGGVALSTFGAYGSAVRSGQGAIASGGRMAGSKVSSGISSVRDKISNPAGRIKSQ